ncbi:arginase family protein [Klebsiella variicola]|uniref:arginase family protein n=1 Tax=Klebsiella variicola TaxID=244366 RepID=UPI003A4D9CB3
MMNITLTCFQGRAGDHNDLAIPGARAIAESLASILDMTPVSIGHPEPALNTDWRTELSLSMSTLKMMQDHFDEIYASGKKSLAATSRCAVSLSTIPVVVKHNPDACIVWFDSHADLNTPSSSETGYLGGLALSGPAGMWDSGLGNGLPFSSIILVGQRDLDPFEIRLIEESAVTYIAFGDDYLERLRQAINGRPVYMHLDCDVLEPGIVPTDYVHPEGMTLCDLEAACEVLAETEVVGLEIAEFQHTWNEGGLPVSPIPLLKALQPVIGKLSEV